MDTQRLLRFVQSLDGARADKPFPQDETSVVFRHVDTRRWFGILFPVPKSYFGGGQGSELCLNVKCPPERAAMLCASYAGILPAYHMNKAHWITVRLDGSVPDGEIEDLLLLSRELTARKKRGG